MAAASIRKVLADIAQKSDEAFIRKFVANEVYPKHIRDLTRKVIDIQDKSTHILDNPGLTQEALLVHQAKQQLEDTVNNVLRKVEIFRFPTFTPRLTRSLMGVMISLFGYSRYQIWIKREGEYSRSTAE